MLLSMPISHSDVGCAILYQYHNQRKMFIPMFAPLWPCISFHSVFVRQSCRLGEPRPTKSTTSTASGQSFIMWACTADNYTSQVAISFSVMFPAKGLWFFVGESSSAFFCVNMWGVLWMSFPGFCAYFLHINKVCVSQSGQHSWNLFTCTQGALELPSPSSVPADIGETVQSPFAWLYLKFWLPVLEPRLSQNQMMSEFFYMFCEHKVPHYRWSCSIRILFIGRWTNICNLNHALAVLDHRANRDHLLGRTLLKTNPWIWWSW